MVLEKNIHKINHNSMKNGSIYPIYTCTLAMAEPWPSEVLFTLGKLYPRQTGQHRRDCLGEGQV